MSQAEMPLSIIVGGSSGIGYDVARRFVSRGENVAVVARDADKLEQAVSDLGDNAEAWPADLYDRAAVAGLISKIEGEKRPISCLVNAAGTFAPQAFLSHTGEDYDRYLEINRSIFFITQSVAKVMVEVGAGSIVNVGSMWAKQAVKATPSSAYSMAKAGLHSLTQHLAMELGEAGIRVNAVSPAVVHTPIYEAFIPRSEVAKTLGGFAGIHPLGRIGKPEDVGQIIDLLASDASQWVTGAVWDVDGGVMAGRT